MRIWPMNFSEYTLEAANDGVVTNIALSEDASKVACGTSIGTLNILDLATNDCKNHMDNIKKSLNESLVFAQHKLAHFESAQIIDRE